VQKKTQKSHQVPQLQSNKIILPDAYKALRKVTSEPRRNTVEMYSSAITAFAHL